MLKLFKTPATIYPLEGPDTITEDDLVELEAKVDALVHHGFLEKKEARIILRLLAGEKIRAIALGAGLSQQEIVDLVTAAIPRLQAHFPNKYFN
jgi:hypothetical protein